jgi:hypothetical protein
MYPMCCWPQQYSVGIYFILLLLFIYLFYFLFIFLFFIYFFANVTITLFIGFTTVVLLLAAVNTACLFVYWQRYVANTKFYIKKQ